MLGGLTMSQPAIAVERQEKPRLSLLRQNPNSSSLLIRLQDGAEVVRLPVGSLTKPQEDEVGGGGGQKQKHS